MRRIVLIVPALVALGACHFSKESRDRDAGPEVSRNFPVGAFDRIEVMGPYNVQVTTGGQPSVTAKGGQSLLDETDVIVDGSTLKIQPKKHDGFRWSWHNGNATFTVSAAALRAASLAGSGGVEVDKVAGDFDADVAGSGDLNIGAVNGGKVKVGIAGSGNVRAGGAADAVDLSIAGSGDIDLSGVTAKAAEASIAGSGNIRAKATDTAKVSIIGSGNVDISGGAKCEVSKTGSGDVTCH